jgi:hypothetical protein
MMTSAIRVSQILGGKQLVWQKNEVDFCHPHATSQKECVGKYVYQAMASFRRVFFNITSKV